MARYNGNGIFLSIDGNTITGSWKEVELTSSIEEIDTTQGVGQTYLQRSEGLRDVAITLMVGYDPDTVQAQLAMLRPGIHTVVFGPEGNSAGKPRHEQAFLFTEAPLGQDVKKKEVVFTVSGSGADAPTVDMFNGGVFS